MCVEKRTMNIKYWQVTSYNPDWNIEPHLVNGGRFKAIDEAQTAVYGKVQREADVEAWKRVEDDLPSIGDIIGAKRHAKISVMYQTKYYEILKEMIPEDVAIEYIMSDGQIAKCPVWSIIDKTSEMVTAMLGPVSHYIYNQEEYRKNNISQREEE